MKIETSELVRAALDWAVAKAEGYEIVRMRGNEITFLDRTEDGALSEKCINYSTDWAQGGPIIEREVLDVFRNYSEGCWQAESNRYGGCPMGRGPSPLIAAMRCFVASRLGDEVEIPSEIV